jgi:hypothetical protein
MMIKFYKTPAPGNLYKPPFYKLNASGVVMAGNRTMQIGALLILLLAGLAAGADYDEVIIGINITQQLSIDVSPNTVNWSGLNIGETGDP